MAARVALHTINPMRPVVLRSPSGPTDSTNVVSLVPEDTVSLFWAETQLTWK